MGLGAAAVVTAVLLLFPIPASATTCTLMRVKSAAKADLKVFFTRFEKEDRTGGRYRRCKLVTAKQDGTRTFLITPFRQDANLIVLRKNWP